MSNDFSNPVEAGQDKFLSECHELSLEIESVFLESIRLLNYYSDNYATGPASTNISQAVWDAYRFTEADFLGFVSLMNAIYLMASGQQAPMLDYQELNNKIK